MSNPIGECLRILTFLLFNPLQPPSIITSNMSATLSLAVKENFGTPSASSTLYPYLSHLSHIWWCSITLISPITMSGDTRYPLFFPLQSQFSSVAQTCPTLCDPMDCSTPGLPVHHQLPEFTKTHVHCICDAIQPSHPLSSSSPNCLKSFPASGSFQMSQPFASGGQSIGVSASTSVLPMNTQDWSLGWTGWISLQSKGLLTDSLQSESYISPQHSVSEPLWTPHHSLVTTIRHLAQYPWTYCHYSPGLRDAHNALTNTGAIPISPKLTAVSDDPQLVPHHPVCDSSHTTVSGNPLLHSKARTACSCPLCTWHTPV